MMDSGFLWVYFWFFGVLYLWGLAFVRLNKQVGGVKLFFKHLSVVAVLLTIVSSLIMYSAKDCVGLMCGLLELLITFAIIAATLIIWPLIMVLVIAPKRANTMTIKQDDWDDVLDH